MNKKIVLINPPCYNKYDDRKLQPLGLAYLCASLRESGFDCNIYDANLGVTKSIDEIVKELLSIDFYLLGFTLLEDTYLSAVEIVNKLKKYKRFFAIAGGIFVTIAYNYIKANTSVFDLLICGDGEDLIIKAASYYEKIFALEESKLNQKEEHSFDYLNQAAKEMNRVDVNHNIWPDRDHCERYSKLHYNGEDYLNLPIVSSRGCPYRCVFCCVPKLQYRWSPRNVDDIVNEIRHLELMLNSNLAIVFTDDNLLLDADRAVRIFKDIQSNCRNKVVCSFATRVDQVVSAGTDKIKELKKYGCVSIELGIENGSNQVLKRFNKDCDVSVISKGLEIVRKSGIFPSIDYIMFDPYTSLDELTENIRFLKAEKLWGYYPPRIYNRVVPYMGTSARTQYYSEPWFRSKYFKYEKTEKVYDIIQKFRSQYQNLIDSVLLHLDAFNSVDATIDKLYLRLIPYIIFENAVESSKRNEEFIYDREKLVSVLDKYRNY